MRLGLVMIYASQPLRAIVGRGQHIRGRRELHRPAIGTGLRIDSQRQIEWSSGAPQIAQRAEVQVEPRVVGEQ